MFFEAKCSWCACTISIAVLTSGFSFAWVFVITYVCLLNRLSRLSKDFGVIVEALRKSKTGLMEINEDKTKIRRSPNKPLPELNDQYKAAIKNRSVYVVSKFFFTLCCPSWLWPITIPVKLELTHTIEVRIFKSQFVAYNWSSLLSCRKAFH